MLEKKEKKSKKYLVLMQPEEDFPPMLNTQRFNFMEMILLCKKTNRTFVLPDILSQPRNNTIAESGELDHKKFILGNIFFPFEKFFDINLLSKYVNIIPFKDFIEISKRKISELYCFRDYFSEEIEIYGKKFSCEKSIISKDLKSIFNSEKPFIAISGYSSGKYLVESFPTWPKRLKKEYWDITKHLQYNQDLIKKADNFINEKNLNHYLAVHWRRGDRVHPEIADLAEKIITDEEVMKKRIDDFMIRPIKKIMKRHNLNKIFLATNSGTKWHLDYLKSKLPIVQYPSSKNWKKREEESILEQIICIKSDYFFAAPHHYEQCSNFSRWIIDLRIVLEKGKMISHQLKMQDSVFKAKLYVLKDKLLLKARYLFKIIIPRRFHPRFARLYTIVRQK